MSPGPVRVAVVNDYEIVVAGVAALLEPYAGRVVVAEMDARMPVVSDVDVILYDTFGQVQGDGIDLEELVAEGGEAKVVVFSWNTDPALVQRALARGAAAYLSKELDAGRIVDALERVHAGERIVPERASLAETVSGTWPGRAHGLTARESEVIALITQGLSNQEIADRSYLSINSVKTYIRTGYRKIGVTRRAQAVAWGMQHGFTPDRSRLVGPQR
ncbi:LuxR C-terminal-related transcriptional regulator [Nocardioides dongkuii]|uniref:LuxR C-terminal-related transcriptional regulator n=1 Tax=Nocardioides dongkuii TaxID=2760089 RepID=UPI0015F956F4|nr:response regulator transcription factor [Nocardioides dongkuii]